MWQQQLNSFYHDAGIKKRGLKYTMKHRDDVLRISASLKLGHIRAAELIKSLFTNNRPSSLANALVKFIDDEEYRIHILTQFNKDVVKLSPMRNFSFH